MMSEDSYVFSTAAENHFLLGLPPHWGLFQPGEISVRAPLCAVVTALVSEQGVGCSAQQTLCQMPGD